MTRKGDEYMKSFWGYCGWGPGGGESDNDKNLCERLNGWVDCTAIAEIAISSVSLQTWVLMG